VGDRDLVLWEEEDHVHGILLFIALSIVFRCESALSQSTSLDDAIHIIKSVTADVDSLPDLFQVTGRERAVVV
jgi:hypothetical protein